MSEQKKKFAPGLSGIPPRTKHAEAKGGSMIAYVIPCLIVAIALGGFFIWNGSRKDVAAKPGVENSENGELENTEATITDEQEADLSDIPPPHFLGNKKSEGDNASPTIAITEDDPKAVAEELLSETKKNGDDELTGEKVGEVIAEEKVEEEKLPESPYERLRLIDGFVRTQNLDKAREHLQLFINDISDDKLLAQAYYRLGIVGRYMRQEKEAVGSWQKAYEAYPETAGGRLAALALADTAFAAAAGKYPVYERWEEIRDLYSAAMGMDGAPFLQQQVKDRVVKNLDLLNARLVFSSAKLNGSMAVYHEVKGGEFLSTIARKYGVNWTSIAEVNGINPNRIRKGMILKIIKADCKIVVDKRNLTLTWYLNDKWIRQYPCCIGPNNKTPAGTYTIVTKDVKPAWRNPADGRIYAYGHPKNVLGTRWLGLEGGSTNGLGIHGTADPGVIPGRTSNGCVRLKNEDVEQLYGFALIGSTVIIR